MLRKALTILSGNTSAAILALVRNLLVARLIPVEDYGIAATFALVLAVVEMTSDIGLQKQIVQSKDGEDPRFQSSLHGFQLLRGLVASGALFLLAGPIASFMRVPEVTWAYRLLALVPLLLGFTHFDTFRLSRRMRFGPMLLVGALPPAIGVLAVWPLVTVLGDYRVMLCLVLLQPAMALLIGHVLAERRYRISFDLGIVRHSLNFGWPLLINNVLLFGVYYADRAIVGREVGLESLAILSMGLTLIMAPALVLARSLDMIFLPKLSGLRDKDQAAFDQTATLVQQAGFFMGCTMVVLVQSIGAPVVHALLGEKYLALLPLLTWLAIMQALRVFKTGASTIAVAMGATRDVMYANMSKLLFLPLVWIAAIQTRDLLPVIAIGIVGELVGSLIAMILLERRKGVSIAHLWSSYAVAIGLLAVAGAGALIVGDRGADFAPLWLVFVLTVALVASFGALPRFRGYVLSLLGARNH